MPEFHIAWIVLLSIAMIPVAGYSTYECTKSEKRLVEVLGEVTAVRTSKTRSKVYNHATYHYIVEGTGRSVELQSLEPEAVGAKRKLWVDRERVDFAFPSREVPCSTGSWWLVLLPFGAWVIYLRIRKHDERVGSA